MEHRLVGTGHVVLSLVLVLLFGVGLWNVARRVGGVWHVVGS